VEPGTRLDGRHRLLERLGERGGPEEAADVFSLAAEPISSLSRISP